MPASRKRASGSGKGRPRRPQAARKRRVPGVEDPRRAGLGVAKADEAAVGERRLERVGDRHRDDVVAPAQDLERLLVARRRGSPRGRRRRSAASGARRRAGARARGRSRGRSSRRGGGRRGRSSGRGRSPSGRDVALDPVGDEEGADPVVVLHGGEGEEARELGHQVALRQVARAERLATPRGRGRGGPSGRAPRRTS